MKATSILPVLAFLTLFSSNAIAQAASETKMPEFMPVLVGLAVLIGVFFMLREVFTWYWKINRRVEIQEKQLQTLLEIYKLLKKEREGEGDGSAVS